MTERGEKVFKSAKQVTIVGLLAVDTETGEEFILQRFTAPVTVMLDDSLTLKINFKGEF